ncbi:hypothetical protein KC973_00320 [Candidatus Saccharibacteria bacterium]|nr:hypothetical protein [Candidatus Saccharibacteria bacterium]
MSTNEEIQALTGFDLSTLDNSDPDQCMAVEGTVYDLLWHVADAGACSHERADELFAEFHRGLGRSALQAS